MTPQDASAAAAKVCLLAPVVPVLVIDDASPDPAVRGLLGRWAARALPGWRFLRLAYFPADLAVSAGPMCCSPTREGLSVRFGPVRVGPPDVSLHEE